ncbi:hypothetical protein LE181_30015, partial [Streptomyces sp. SCA3-4]|uniref:hypothetical protein n=1 Tax=Streptomyces sichuanensis TaxID=2871810 RepID=UPI001CE25C70
APGGAAGRAAGDAPAHPPAGSPHRVALAASAGSFAAAVIAPGGPHVAPPGHGPGGMDPMAVCLAVLGAAGWAVVLLLSFGALRRPADGGAAAGAAWFSRALWPVPPPPRHKALARLSVLRV